MRLVVIIPTVGRKDLLPSTLALLEEQTRPPDEVIVSAPDESHAGPYEAERYDITFLYGRRGSCAQRNIAIDKAVGQADILVFFDDDFLPARDYLEKLERAFAAHPDWAVIRGEAVYDGANGPGYSFAEGLALLRDFEARCATRPIPEQVEDQIGGYGCNMSVRSAAVGRLRFDEKLPLYGWQEDIDFTAQLRGKGRVVGMKNLCGVHLATKAGRVSGVKFGYSQVANPVYLVRKGTVPAGFALKLMARNVAANSVKSLRPEPYIDRFGRLKGNLLAAFHILTGRVNPEYILKL